jgi:uncharacterized protein YfaA (DUF2138 family)
MKNILINSVLFAAFFLYASNSFSQSFDKEPDAIINTKSLFDLPKDIISIPILKDLLTEDFVFYYQNGGSDWLSFRGALARLAYEQNTDFSVMLMSLILNSPAEIALWKGPDGKLSEFMFVVDQSGVKNFISLIAKAALSDTQLQTKKIGDKEITTLTLATGRQVYFSSDDGRLFIYSNSKIPLPTNVAKRDFTDKAKSFFGINEEVSIYGPKLTNAKHSVIFSMKYLSFGYQTFFDSLKAIKFSFTKASWDTEILTQNQFKKMDSKDWSTMPRGAALCVAIPLENKQIEKIIKTESWLAQANANATICWYSNSKFYTPLFGLRGDFTQLENHPEDVKKIFNEVVGAKEAIWVASKNQIDPSTLKWLPKLPVIEIKNKNKIIGFTREVGGRYGMYPSKKSGNSKLLGSYRFFRVKLMFSKDAILFSPDDTLVDNGMLTLTGKFPSMLTSLPAQGKDASFVIAPDKLSVLVKQLVIDALPQQQESIFRTAVSRHLFPNLEKFGKRPLQAATIGNEGIWKKILWSENVVR